MAYIITEVRYKMAEVLWLGPERLFIKARMGRNTFVIWKGLLSE